MKVEYEAVVYLPSYVTIEDVANGKSMPMISEHESSYFEGEGYPLIGKAVVTIELDSQDKIVANQISALEAQLQTVRAENQQRENAITDKISKLQALTMS